MQNNKKMLVVIVILGLVGSSFVYAADAGDGVEGRRNLCSSLSQWLCPRRPVLIAIPENGEDLPDAPEPVQRVSCGAAKKCAKGLLVGAAVVAVAGGGVVYATRSQAFCDFSVWALAQNDQASLAQVNASPLTQAVQVQQHALAQLCSEKAKLEDWDIYLNARDQAVSSWARSRNVFVQKNFQPEGLAKAADEWEQLGRARDEAYNIIAFNCATRKASKRLFRKREQELRDRAFRKAQSQLEQYAEIRMPIDQSTKQNVTRLLKNSR